MTRLLLVLLIAFVTASSALAVPTYPTLPQATVDTTYSLPTGTTFTPANSSEFATALTNAALNDVIVLAAGTTYTGPFSLPDKVSGSGWIYIVSSALASLPASGTRVSTSDAANMPTITAAVGEHPISTANGAHHFRFVGVRFLAPTSASTFTLAYIHSSGSSAVDYPEYIIFDRCLFQGDATVSSIRGVWLDGNHLAVIESYLENFKHTTSDSQAILGTQGNGPILIHNNFLEGAGENVLFGGSDPSVANSVPQDITITRNHFFKRLAWINSAWQVKNLLELKNARRVLVHGNTFENGWVEEQTLPIVFTPRNEGGTASWSTVEDVTFRYNKVINVDYCFSFQGEDNNQTSQVMSRMWLHNNLVLSNNVNSATHRMIQVSNPGAGAGPVDLIVEHNTMLMTDISGSALGYSSNVGFPADKFVFRNNLVHFGEFGFSSDQGAGTTALNTHYTNYTWTNNALIGGSGTYPANTWFPANAAAVGFVDYAGGNYRLAPASDFAAGNVNDASDGTDLGANIDAIEAAIAGAAGSSGCSAAQTCLPFRTSDAGLLLAAGVVGSQNRIGRREFFRRSTAGLVIPKGLH